MTLEKFADEHDLQQCAPFAVERLYCRPGNPSFDTTGLLARHYDFFEQRSTGWPGAVIAHVVDGPRVREAYGYARRHRCEAKQYPSWHRPLIAVVIFRRDT